MSTHPTPNHLTQNKHTITLTLLLTAAFDYTTSSQSILEFRILYNIAFILMSSFILNILTNLNKNEHPNWRIKATLPRGFTLITLMVNLLSLASMHNTQFIGVGSLDKIMFNQATASLPPFLFYTGILMLNSIILLSLITPAEEIDFAKIPLISLLLISVETFSASWLFNHLGTIGLFIAVIAFHAGLSFASLYLWRLNRGSITVNISSSDFGLLLFSLGLILMCFTPQGLYSQFSDTSVILDTEVSILLRGDLKPYYATDNYYPAVGGFVSSVFQLSTGLRNLMLSSSLAYLAAYFILPSMIYSFLKSYVTKNEQVALIGAVFCVFADGLAVMFYPQFNGYFTHEILHWVISPATESLQFSPIIWFWYSPYKILGLSSAIAVGLTPKYGRYGVLLGGAFVALSFMNARQPAVAFTLLVYLLWVGVIDLKYAFGTAASALIFLGPLSGPILSNFSSIPLSVLKSIGFLNTNSQAYILGLGKGLTQNPEYSYMMAFIGLIITALLLRRGFNIQPNKTLLEELSPRDGKWTHPASKLLLPILLAATILYALFYAQLQFTKPGSSILTGAVLLPFSVFVLRHPALAALSASSLAIYRYSVKQLVLAAVCFSLAYFTLIVNHIVYVALIVALFALPAFEYHVRHRSRLVILLVSGFLLAGFFSGTAYAALAKVPESDPYEQDLPGAVNALLTLNTQEKVFSPSPYIYFAERIIHMANLKPTYNPSKIVVIDKNYIAHDSLQKYLESPFIIFNGSSILIVRLP